MDSSEVNDINAPVGGGVGIPPQLIYHPTIIESRLPSSTNPKPVNLLAYKTFIVKEMDRRGEPLMSKPVDVGSVKVGQYIIVDNEPCRVVEYEKSKPGKHGAAKARIVAIGLFSEQKKNVISPVDAKIDVPIIEKRSGQIISVIDETVQIMDLETYETFETPLPKESELRSKLNTGVEVEYWRMAGGVKIVRTK